MTSVSLTRFARLHPRVKAGGFHFADRRLGRAGNGTRVTVLKSDDRAICRLSTAASAGPTVAMSNGEVRNFTRIAAADRIYRFRYDGSRFVDGSASFDPAKYYRDRSIFLQVAGDFAVGDAIDIGLSTLTLEFESDSYAGLAAAMATADVVLLEWPPAPPSGTDGTPPPEPVVVPVEVFSGTLVGGDDFPDPSEAVVCANWSVCWMYAMDDLAGDAESANVVYDWDWLRGPNHWVPR